MVDRQLPKNTGFGYFWTGSWKLNCHIWNQHPRIFLIAKLCEKTKMPKFGTRNALFGYFWSNMPFLGYFWTRILKKLLSYLQSAPSNLSNLSIYKTLRKKSLNLGPKMPYLGIFDQKCDIWVFLCCNFKKLLSHLKPPAPEFV